MTGQAVGIIANPAAGKDIRRLVSAASPVSDMAKIGIIRRAAIGAMEGGATRLVVADDRHALARRALASAGLPTTVLDLPLFSTGRDSQRAAAAMAEAGVGAVIVLGGDGTHRDVVKGWRHAPLVALSTGTNNVFPRAHEATVAGHAAGLVASGSVALDEVADRAKIIDVIIDDPDRSDEGDGTDPAPATRDLGLVDVALTTASFTGSRAVWDVGTLRQLVTAIAEPASVGLSAIAAAVAPTARHEPGGVWVRFPADVPHNTAASRDGGGTTAESTREATIADHSIRLRCALAPGLYADVDVVDHRRLDGGDEVVMAGPGVLSFDGERDVILGPTGTARLRIEVDGPPVIDIARALALGRTDMTSTKKARGG